jgi:hypothetical protein
MAQIEAALLELKARLYSDKPPDKSAQLEPNSAEPNAQGGK